VLSAGDNTVYTYFASPSRIAYSDFFHLSNYKVYVYIVRHNYVLGGMLFTIYKPQLHVSAINVVVYI
jgi:hypothetical protein